ncbi:MAG: hypothetical protein FJ096_03430, partial [Deltaproteobacteria bacterium]|nr:hypothetical protein [Deltaproteobacteria bacterium]
FDAVERGRTFGTVSTVALVAGGALTVAGVVIFLTAPSPSTPGAQALTVRPTHDGTGAFVGLSGRF